MKWFDSSQIAAGVLLAAVASLVVFACSTPTKVDLKAEAFGVKLEVVVDSAGNPVGQYTGELPAGLCLKIEYRGSNGELVGTDTIHVPGSSQIPAGAKSQSFSFVECPHDSIEPASTGGLVHARHAVPYAKWVDICGYPILPDLVNGGVYRNAMYHFRVKAVPGVDPFTRIEPILRGGPGTPVPPDVDVVSFTQFIPETLGGRMIVADTRVFDQFRLDWNGQIGYADLSTGTNVLQYGVGSQWQVIESFIQLQDFHALVGESNHGVTVRKTVAESSPATVDATLTVLSF